MGELSFRKSIEDDLSRISEFRKCYFAYNSSKRCYEPEYYRWKYFGNPVQQGEIWLAEDNDVIAGMYGITPKKIKVFETELNGAEVGDSFTQPDYQRRGIMTKIGTTLIENGLREGISFIYGIGNAPSLSVAEKKLGYRRVPIKLRPLIKPVYMKQVVKAHMHVPRSIAALLSLAAFFSPVIKVASDITTRIGAIGGTKSGISISRVSIFPDDIDVFWERAAKSYDIVLARRRDYLQWRFINNPDNYSILLATDKVGATVGYMVTKVAYYSGIPVGFIVDFLTLEDNQGIFKKLFLSSLEEFFQVKVSIIFTSAVKGNFYDKLLLRFGFIPYRRDALICYENELGNQVLSRNPRWHFTMGDSDNI